MARIYISFLWHMHQPFYKDLISGEYKLPWTRMHALKDYYGMVRLLDEFPRVRQTFNLVPSMMVQVEEYATGTAADPYLQVAVKPAEALTEEERTFLLKQFFHAHPQQMIYRYPRYAELYEAAGALKGLKRSGNLFGVQEYRDLQVLSQLAWFDEEFQEKDVEVVGHPIPEVEPWPCFDHLHADRGGREGRRAPEAGAGPEQAPGGRIFLRIPRDHPKSRRLPPIASDALLARPPTESLFTLPRTVQVRHRVVRLIAVEAHLPSPTEQS